MLNESQIEQVWRGMLAAETRALYFADLTRKSTIKKQWLMGASFFLASGAAAELLAKGPAWIATASTGLVAVISAYTIAVNPDKNIATLTKLSTGWDRIADEYKILWDHTYADDAEDRLLTIMKLERECSELAIAGVKYDPKLLGYWQNRILQLHNIAAEQHG